MATCKNLSARGVRDNQQPPHFILGPFYISETNVARKLEFGVLVGLYEYYATTYKFVHWGHPGKSAAPNFDFGTFSISPK